MTTATAELELTGARAGYGTVEVLHGLDLAIPAGKVTALLGANGAGKSTSLRVLSGLIPLRAGTLTWRGEDITRLSTVDRARRGLMLVPDERAVFATLSVRDNLQIIAEASGHPDITPALESFPRLRERLTQRAGSMSGGERRMLALARALLARPSVLMVDELSLGLSPKVAADLFGWLATVAASGTTVLLADQYTEQALAMADLVYVLHRGERSFVGTPAEFAGGAATGASALA
ncbi:ABC transporter ATP-binding protein [Frankia sp. QA3]|uniref:ABC transporter ATP-binding protein n=1 Tax=Frankia sp. QA3 TaxID=710111 RepID=UPI000269CA01|nr:ATP-binding cassette domain-containing protein [Frankia sp. QA3]EIV93777.1 ABC-type branched-chain amino acid transport system, ATPase component [Frankia sp. QA3]